MKLSILSVSIALVIASCGGASIKSSSSDKWQTLKPLEKYKSSAFKLRKDIKHVEIRRYTSSSSRSIGSGESSMIPYSAKSFSTLFSITSKSDFNKKLLEEFKSLKPIWDADANIKKQGHGGMFFTKTAISNVFYIMENDEAYREHKIKDVLPLLDKIDTPAEAQFILFLHDKPEAKSYKKVANGYKLLIEYKNTIDNYGECGWFRYNAHIGSNGKLVAYKLLKKTTKDISCMTYD